MTDFIFLSTAEAAEIIQEGATVCSIHLNLRISQIYSAFLRKFKIIYLKSFSELTSNYPTDSIRISRSAYDCKGLSERSLWASTILPKE